MKTRKLTLEDKVNSIVEEALYRYGNALQDVMTFLKKKAERAEYLANTLVDEKVATLHMLLAVEIRTRIMDIA